MNYNYWRGHNLIESFNVSTKRNPIKSRVLRKYKSVKELLR